MKRTHGFNRQRKKRKEKKMTPVYQSHRTLKEQKLKQSPDEDLWIVVLSYQCGITLYRI